MEIVASCHPLVNSISGQVPGRQAGQLQVKLYGTLGKTAGAQSYTGGFDRRNVLLFCFLVQKRPVPLETLI